MLKNVTISDIAKLVGVSKATVSYYLNGNYKKMSSETKEKIRTAIQATGYQPSRIAKSLVTKDTQTIGVVIADITNPFISSVMKGIHDACKECGYAVNFTNSDNDIETELENLQRLNQQDVSGIILDSVDADHPMIKSLDNRQTVMVDRQSKELLLDTVVSDNEASTEKFLLEMKAAGYDDIYFVTFPIDGISTRELRYDAFKKVVSSDPEKMIVLGAKGTETAIFNILKESQNSSKKPAFFTMNGPALLSFMKLINPSHYHYPRDFGLGSYEDLGWMEVLNPNVSCIRQDSYKIGRVATKHLVEKLRNEEAALDPQLIEVANTIVLRNSF